MPPTPSAPGPLPPGTTFMAACLRGEVAPEAIHDALVAWNAGDQRMPVHLFLGMTEPEWKLYLEAEGNLEQILRTRRTAHLYKPKPGAKGGFRR